MSYVNLFYCKLYLSYTFCYINAISNDIFLSTCVFYPNDSTQLESKLNAGTAKARNIL